jgi:glycosyltransferase involved in cell wall biosynthesis
VKVLLLADTLKNGGLERQMALLAARLPSDCRRRVVAMHGGQFQAYLNEHGVPVTVRERRYRFDPSPAALLWRDLSIHPPDVVHSWSWMSTLAAGPACRLLGIPLIDGTIQTGAYRGEFLGINRLGMAFATLVVANTRAGLQAWGIPAARGRVVNNGFDELRLPKPRRGPRADPRFTVIMTGRMAPEKHYDVVLAAARLLAGSPDAWRFVLVGDGPDRRRLMVAAQDLVALGIVTFPKPGMDVLEFVRDADIGVLMTDPRIAFEGLSNSIIEYMALGLPVVCGAGGGNPELVFDGVTGFIVPPADPEALASRLAYLRENEEERRAMGAAGKARVARDFSVETMVRRMLDVYDEAIRRR